MLNAKEVGPVIATETQTKNLADQEYLVVSMFRRLDKPKKQFAKKTFEAVADNQKSG